VKHIAHISKIYIGLIKPIRAFYSAQEYKKDSDELFLEIPQKEFRVMVSDDEEYFLEDKKGEIHLDEGID